MDLLLGFAFMSFAFVSFAFMWISNFKKEMFKKEISKYQPTCLNRLITTNPGLNTFQRNIDPRKKFHLTNFSMYLIV